MDSVSYDRIHYHSVITVHCLIFSEDEIWIKELELPNNGLSCMIVGSEFKPQSQLSQSR